MPPPSCERCLVALVSLQAPPALHASFTHVMRIGKRRRCCQGRGGGGVSVDLTIVTESKNRVNIRILEKLTAKQYL